MRDIQLANVLEQLHYHILRNGNMKLAASTRVCNVVAGHPGRQLRAFLGRCIEEVEAQMKSVKVLSTTSSIQKYPTSKSSPLLPVARFGNELELTWLAGMQHSRYIDGQKCSCKKSKLLASKYWTLHWSAKTWAKFTCPSGLQWMGPDNSL